MIFDLAISLGINCQCRYHIARQLYARAHSSTKGFTMDELNITGKDSDYGSFFFDWSVSPLASVIKLLNNGFDQVLQRKNLTIKAIDSDANTVVDTFTNFEYPHTFTHKLGKITHTEAMIDKHYPQVKEKYTYLKNKTLTALHSNKNLLFVLLADSPDYERLLQLSKALEQYTSRYKILYAPIKNSAKFHVNDEIANDSRFLVRPIRYQEYPGDNASWADAFTGLNLLPPSPGT